jgi:hypothetical protein
MSEFELVFNGGQADRGLLEFYDASHALVGFQRSLALTTHLVLHGEIITQAPAASGFEIFLPAIEAGSWKSRAVIVFSATVAMTSAGKDSPLGQIVTSVYDAALHSVMGFHVDYEKTLQQQYTEYLRSKSITPERIDSLCEKIEASVAEMHRPIVRSGSATRAQVKKCGLKPVDIGPILSPLTYEYVRQTKKENDDSIISGYVSSYNINTYKGRIFCLKEKRPIPFELEDSAKTKKQISLLTTSQHINGQDRNSLNALIALYGNRLISQNGRTKRFMVHRVEEGL